MKPEQIKKVFEEYITDARAQYALSINGGWGCGKTYFWKHELEKIGLDNKKKLIYISLFGLDSIEQLKDRFFLQRYKKFGIIQKIISKSKIRILGRIEFPTLESIPITFIRSKSLRNYIICFDDFERCRIPIEQILGYINDLAENRNGKIVILTNESEIEDLEGYKKFKEKVIGRDLLFEYNKLLIPELFKDYSDEMQSFLSRWESFIVDGIIIKYGQKNIRIIKYILDCLNRIYLVVKPYTNRDEIVKEIILFVSLIVFECKKGCLTFDDRKGLDTLEGYDLYPACPEEGNSSDFIKRYKREFDYNIIDKYIDCNRVGFNFYYSLYIYITTGYFDPNELKKEIELRIERGYPGKERGERIWDFFNS